MGTTRRLGVTAAAADRMRRWARLWVVAVLGATTMIIAVRWLTAGDSAPDWEPQVRTATLLAVALGAVVMWRSDVLAAVWMGGVAVAGGVTLAAHYGPLSGAAPVVGLIPPAVLFALAWQRIRSPMAVGVFLSAAVIVLVAGGVAARALYEDVYGPTHPESLTPAPADSSIRWMWAGATTSHGFTVVAGLEHSERAELLVWTEPGTARVAAAGAPSEVIRFETSDLEPETTYHYAVRTPTGTGPTGSVRTFPDGPSDLVIAFSSCARLGSNGRVFDAIRELDPDLYIAAGDWFYGDIGRDDPDAFAAAYMTTLTRPAQAALYRSTSTAYIWDDHDYALNDADASAPSRPAAMEAYRVFVPHYPLAGPDSPIDQAFTIGRVRVVMLDTRSARTEAGILDQSQWEWFEGELRAARRRGQLVLWVNTIPWIAEDDPGADHWGGSAEERAELGRLIEEVGAPVVMLGGDAHMIALDDGTNSGYGQSGPGFVVFHAGALDRPGSVKGGPYTQGAYPGGGQFGVVEVADDGTTLAVLLRGMDWEGRIVVEHRLVVEDL